MPTNPNNRDLFDPLTKLVTQLAWLLGSLSLIFAILATLFVHTRFRHLDGIEGAIIKTTQAFGQLGQSELLTQILMLPLVLLEWIIDTPNGWMIAAGVVLAVVLSFVISAIPQWWQSLLRLVIITLIYGWVALAVFALASTYIVDPKAVLEMIRALWYVVMFLVGLPIALKVLGVTYLITESS
ncbi:hypothetical protein [Ferrimonas sp. SCSIO 43195]|uniref:hypothetical protein n=1 Tax=Ferrimonas sp. SCSIO 43195 TaxID=2822844 RepID=UPI0020765332|nr:hypothetical protein [Ferrimonas sp. SCSIO 43195]USD37004.1 hypothetical protein J8Z22_18725 [Ferrimonas sp. SCSIO 43195]